MTIRRGVKSLVWVAALVALFEATIRVKYYLAHDRDTAYLAAGFAGRYTGAGYEYRDDDSPVVRPFAVNPNISARDTPLGPMRFSCENRTWHDAVRSLVVHTTYNADCLRGSTTMAKPPGVLRVAIVGDSTIEGLGVDDTETVPAVLEQLLNRTPPAGRPPGVRYEVLNAGLSGATARELIRAIDKLRFYAPDLIVYYEGFNDAKRHVFWAADRIGAVGRSHSLTAAIYSHLYYRSMAYTYVVEKYFLYQQKHQEAAVKADMRLRDDFDSSVRGTIAIVRAQHVPFVMVKQVIREPIVIESVDTLDPQQIKALYDRAASPSIADRLTRETTMAISQRYAMSVMETIARASGVPVIDFGRAYDREVPKTCFIDVVHQTADGDRRLAEYLADALGPYLPIRPPDSRPASAAGGPQPGH